MESYSAFDDHHFPSSSHPPAAEGYISARWPAAAFYPPSQPSEVDPDVKPALSSVSGPLYSNAPSPRARTHSTTSSISSFQSSYLEAASPDISACTSHLPYDPSVKGTLSSDQFGQGFVVFNDRTGDQISIHWDQLVQLLVDPQTISGLAPSHPIAQASHLLASLPAPTLSAEVDSGLLESMNDGMAPLSAGLQGFSLASDPSRSSDPSTQSQTAEAYAFDPPQTARPLRSTFSSVAPPRLPASSAQLPPLPASNRSIDPRSFAEPTGEPSSRARVNLDSHSLPVPPARLRRADSDYTSPSRHHTTPYARPQSFYQQESLSASSLQEFAGQPVASSAASFRSLGDVHPLYSRTPPGKEIARKRTRGLRSLNTETEVYGWSVYKSQLFRRPSNTPESDVLEESGWNERGEMVKLPMEIITFSPGTYFKAFEDDVEILPSDNTARANTFLRSQHCVLLCNFRFEGKRPSVIRHHVVSCKARAREITGADPLKRLCELQLEAQKAISKHRIRLPLQRPLTRGDDGENRTEFDGAPPPLSSADDSDTGDDRSIYSFESVDPPGERSAQGTGRPVSFVGPVPTSHSSPQNVVGSTESNHSWWSTKPSNSNDAVQALVEASALAQSDPSFTAVETTNSDSPNQPDWLQNYGLKTPTLRTALEHQQSQQMAIDSPPPRPVPSLASTQSASFLAMD